MSNYINYDNFDFSVNPLDDFYKYTNGNWLKNNKIPDDYTKWGTFEVLNEENSKKLKNIITSSKGKFIILKEAYDEYINFKKRDKLGKLPIQEKINELEKCKDNNMIWVFICRNYKLGLLNLFHLFGSEDSKNSDIVIPHFFSGGIGLPDRDYYFNKDKKEHRRKYLEFLQNCIKLYDGKKLDLEFIISFETELAEKLYTNVERRDPKKRYNKFNINEFIKKTNLDWKTFFNYNFKNIQNFIVDNPSFFSKFGEIFNNMPTEKLKIILKVNILSNYSSYLSTEFYDNKFEFSRKFLAGQKNKKELWQRGVNFVDGYLGEFLGEKYVEIYFSKKSKNKMEELVFYLISTLKNRINELTWMSPETKEKAFDKLSNIKYKIGYPSKWRSFDKLNFSKCNNLIEMIFEVHKFNFEHDMSRFYKKVDKHRWEMSAHAVNAYFHPLRNEIVFPAGILQKPFFDVNADDAYNFGGIGSVIGHELTHGFDDKGRLYDSNGNLNNWWTKSDEDKFKIKSKYFINEYNKVNVNGEFTLGENLADHGGVKISYYALEQKLKDEFLLNSKIDGLSYHERFFISYSNIWKSLITEEEYNKRLLTDVHSPNEYRVNITLSNIPEFHMTFGTMPHNKMYRKNPEQIW